MLEDLPVSSQLEIWSWCIGRAAELGRYITSPFRADSHPGCVLKNWNGAVILMDSSGRTGHGFTCLHAVAHFKGFYKTTGLNLYLAKSLVLYNLTFGTKPLLCPEPVLTGFKKSEETIDTLIKFYPKGGSESPGWTQEDLEYWSKRGVTTSQLEDNSRGGRVFSCSHYIINESVFKAQGLCYAYTINDKVKIYQPVAPKELKWFSTVTPDDYWHTQRGCRKLFISKANKDHLIAENLFLDYDILSPMNEKSLPTNFLELLDCYEETIAVYDNDETGISTLSQLRDYGVKTFIVDNAGCKDIDDVITRNQQLKFKELK